MRCIALAIGASLIAANFVSAIPYRNNGAFESLKSKRQRVSAANQSLLVDLGYEIYQGYYDNNTTLNTWRGIRFAAPPTGNLRWQPPQTPALNRNSIIQANSFASRCPQSGRAPNRVPYCEISADATTLPESCLNTTAFQSFQGAEDCLFLNIQSPPNAENLPVLVWIHGGGYGQGNGTQTLHRIINTNNQGFVGVSIQYRLGAFGFLSSDEVYRFGTANAGIYDQHFVLQWISSYISLFGGDPTRVTISGLSAGGGSVMLQSMAYGGTQGNYFFNNAIAASPYLPMQYGYADFVPSQSYYAFAANAGCFTGLPFTNNTASIIECLRGRDTLILQQASAYVSTSSEYGTWGFLPVTDGKLVQQLPSQQLLQKQVNGVNMLSGNNANEGPPFVPQYINTEDEFVNYLRQTFPLFDEDDIAKILLYYPSTNANDDLNAPLFHTLGESGPTAINQSAVATGQQQRANNIYAETTFVCPSYWLAEAYAQPGHAGYKYQFSVPPALHGNDLLWYFGPLPQGQSQDVTRAFMQMWGNFVINNNPSIPSVIANGFSTSNMTYNAASNWPQYSAATPYQININQTGQTMGNFQFGNISSPTVVEPGLMSAIDLVNAYTWEGGRGFRCDFWRSVGTRVPE